MDTLGTRKDLLAAHKEVVAVGVARVLGVGHGVERSDSGGEFVEDIEVSVILREDEAAEMLFLGGAVSTSVYDN